MVLRRNLLLGMFALLSAPAWAQVLPFYYAQDGAALSGYDTVSYFDNAEPLHGEPTISVMWRGVKWYFASQENRELFEANPRAYAPQFGGYCAYAVAQGYLTSADPMAWHIVDNRLYLTHSPQIEKIWSRDIPGNIESAEAHWPTVLRE